MIVRALVVSASSLALAFSPAVAQISVRPTLIDFQTQTGPESQVIFIKNTGAHDRSYQVYFGDYAQKENGDHDFLPFGAHEKSCTDRVSLNQSSIRVPPGEEGQVVVTMEPGQGTCWNLLFVEQVALPTSAGRSVITQRIGVKLYGSDALHRSPDPILHAIAFDDFNGEPALRLESENAGDHLLQLAGRIEIFTPAGEKKSTIDVRMFTVLEQHRRTSVHRIPDSLDPGDYVAIALLTDGQNKRIGKRVSFTIPTHTTVR